MLSLFIFFPYAIAITTSTTSTTPASASTTNTVKHTLAKTIPSCAFPCTEHFLESQYPLDECPDRSDIACFCRSRTGSGYTLGEGVLRCMLGGCEADVLRDRANGGYNICEGVEGALRPTHATITVSTGTSAGTGAGTGITTGASTESTSSASSASDAGASPTSETGASPTSETGGGATASPKSTNTAITFTSPTTTNANSGPTSTSSSTSTSTPGSDSTSGSGSSLSPGSVAGVSVASGLSGFFLIALALFLWRRKQRRSKPSDKHYFEIGGVMSEPPDFAFPPRRPMPTKPMPKPIPPPKPNTGRMAETGIPPAVVVTGVDGTQTQTDNIGHAISNLEDEYTDHAAGLYPEPLRWDRRPRSDITTFEEDGSHQQTRRQLQQPVQPAQSLYPNFSGLIGPRPYPGRMATGLPAHPRAMMYGFTPWNPIPMQQQPDSQSQSSTSSSSSGIGSGSGSGSGSDESTRYYNQHAQVNPYPEIGTGIGPEQRVSRHSGYFTPLPPVREARTPSRSENTSPIDYTTSPSLRRPHILAPGTGPSTPAPTPTIRAGTESGPSTPTPGPRTRPATPSHPREIISRPRIIHQQDVKRVQIRRCKPPRQRHLEQRQQQRQSFLSRDLNAVPPYSPDDFWYDPGAGVSASASGTGSASCTGTGTGSGSGSGSGSASASATGTWTGTGIWSPPPTGITVASAPTPSMNRLSGSSASASAVDKSITRKPVRQHQLTPARRGGDLILRVD